MAVIFGILESSATHRYQDVTPTQEFFFLIVTSIVYGWNRLVHRTLNWLSPMILDSSHRLMLKLDPLLKSLSVYRVCVGNRTNDGQRSHFDNIISRCRPALSIVELLR
jgi:hypothetical protein